MGSGNTWWAGPSGKTEGREALLRMMRRGGEHAEPALVVCRWCGADEFEVVARECFCVGCCLPLGVPNGWEDGFPGQFPWRLEPTAAPLPPATPGPRIRREEVCWCPGGHGVFETAVAYALEDGRVRGLTVGLRCPEDGTMHLYIDDARVVPVPS
ncbi:hypothetical protein [Streptomyces sp. NBC_00158]|uniref:hypothetical protein n=1 Tax=Streptomyces sp. NBC_00158 TaxID=2903627 RepID=UPI00324E303B